MWHVHVGDCGVCVFGKMSKDTGMGVRKGTVVSFVPTLNCLVGFGDSIPICLFIFMLFFRDLFPLFLGGGGDIELWTIDTHVCIYSYSGDRLR